MQATKREGKEVRISRRVKLSRGEFILRLERMKWGGKTAAGPPKAGFDGDNGPGRGWRWVRAGRVEAARRAAYHTWVRDVAHEGVRVPAGDSGRSGVGSISRMVDGGGGRGVRSTVEGQAGREADGTWKATSRRQRARMKDGERKTTGREE